MSYDYQLKGNPSCVCTLTLKYPKCAAVMTVENTETCMFPGGTSVFIKVLCNTFNLDLDLNFSPLEGPRAIK